jgi:LacI family transcriptional regulator
MAPVKVREVARKLSLSPGTVSKALSGKPGQVSLLTTKTVLDHCCKQGFMSKSEAGQILFRMISSNTGKQIFVVTHFHGVLVYDTIFSGICEQLQRNDLFPSSYLMQDDNSVKSFPYDKAGCAIIIGRSAPAILEELNRNAVPVVLVDNRIPGCKVSAVNTNNMEAVSESVQLLASKGHKRIAFVCNHEDRMTRNYTFHQRQAGYVAGMASAGLPAKDEWLVAGDMGDFDVSDFDWQKCTQVLRSLAKRFLTLDPLPTAVVTANDMTAYILRDVLNESGVRVPEDVSIIGYDGRDKLSAENTGYAPVSTQVVDWHELGREAVDLALNMLYDPEQGPRFLEVPTTYEDAGTVSSPIENIVENTRLY